MTWNFLVAVIDLLATKKMPKKPRKIVDQMILHYIL